MSEIKEIEEIEEIEEMKPFFDRVSGLIFTPSQDGELCVGNGKHKDKDGNLIEICCDNCRAFMCCYPEFNIYKK